MSSRDIKHNNDKYKYITGKLKNYLRKYNKNIFYYKIEEKNSRVEDKKLAWKFIKDKCTCLII
jgi:hypothetical protein